MLVFSKKTKGFTLTELLVVIFIIGLLASIGLVAGIEARKRGKDAGIQANSSQVRTEAAVIYSRSDVYNNPLDALCDVDDTLNNANSNLNLVEIEIMKHNGNQPIDCFANEEAFCVQSPLATIGSYCLDSTGYAGTIANCGTGNIKCAP